MSAPAKSDVVIFGGGVAGLWTRAALAGRGYSVALLECASLGADQTLASQGIIHAGIKYALTGKAGRASRALADAAAIWRPCLAGRRDPDLSRVSVLAERMHLWTTARKRSKLAAWAASKAMRSGVRKLSASERGEALGGAPVNVDLYEVDEPVIDPAGLLTALLAAGTGPCAQITSEPEPTFKAMDGGSTLVSTTLMGEQRVEILAGRVLFCAGVGNESLLRAIGRDPVALAQRRPLHMVLVRDAPIELHGHCIQRSDVPRLTITTSRCGSERVWLVGGDLAERGVERDREAQIAAAKSELSEVLGWLDLSGCGFDAFRIDRAEGRTDDASRPDLPVILDLGGAIAVWPTKLALAPLAAARVVELVEASGLVPTPGAGLTDVVEPVVGTRPWEGGAVSWS
ncbi:MAG: FAD-dependent oxidoreductase [Planctomycetes bacterium]|nr:FAD-dependent oxidoreductase [Planctomycetota bacterium]